MHVSSPCLWSCLRGAMQQPSLGQNGGPPAPWYLAHMPKKPEPIQTNPSQSKPKTNKKTKNTNSRPEPHHPSQQAIFLQATWIHVFGLGGGEKYLLCTIIADQTCDYEVPGTKNETLHGPGGLSQENTCGLLFWKGWRSKARILVCAQNALWKGRSKQVV